MKTRALKSKRFSDSMIRENVLNRSRLTAAKKGCRPGNPEGWAPNLASTRPQIKCILVPIDFSDCSRSSLRWAVSLARKHKARLVVLHVAELAGEGSEFESNYYPELA